MLMRRPWVLLLLACCGLSSAVAAEDNGTPGGRHGRSGVVDGVIVGLQVVGSPRRHGAEVRSRVGELAGRSGLEVRGQRSLGPALELLQLATPVPEQQLAEALAQLASDPDVAFVEPDRRVYAHAFPADPLYPGQWYLQSGEVAAIDAASAWDQSAGSPGTVVAVLDTGVRFDHPDLLQAGRGGRLLPGYDFVSGDGDGGFRVANDGDGRDPNPADPGDWISDSEAALPTFADCEPGPSSWHGTRVAGLIGAIANNGEGLTGTAWSGWILPVRVLGKCFGRNSDIIQGMRWAAGLPVDGVPDNPYPAQVINLSLGGEGGCTASYVSVLNEIAATGALVVASAGNVGKAVEYPASCPGVVAVGGLRHLGTKVGYSNLGPEVALSAPAGNCVNAFGACLYSLDTTYDLGATAPSGPGYTNQLDLNVGTSFSAPLVAGIAALMHGANGNLRAAQLRARLQEGARPFPPPSPGVPACHVPLGDADVQDSECACTTSTCGAGMAHAPRAVAAALRPIAAIALPAIVSPGQNLSLDASGSAAACGRNLAGYQWSVVSGSASISGADTALATLVAPSSGSFTLRLTVTDDNGAQDTAEVTVTRSSATSNAPAAAGSSACPAVITPADPGPFVDDGPASEAPSPVTNGGGGGGSTGLAGLLLLAVLAARRIDRNRFPRIQSAP